ncbi:cytidylyltransferase domain-containing protein [Streptomyces sp. NPDC048192]|uniref:cytidylyltransferase domain-containing protein n=1 Tax=Streptomyces sp. NPDC048192 TaxID=3365510 RepID=UPI00371791AE
MEAKCLDGVVVATDDERIERACHELGVECMRTGEHLTGTDRVAECAEHLPADAYINVQGVEPFVSPTAIDAVSEALERLAPGSLAVNAYTDLDDVGVVLDHNVVKVVVDAEANALMFSRAGDPLPTRRPAEIPTTAGALRLYRFTGTALSLSDSSPKSLWSEPKAWRCCGSSSMVTAC